MNRHSIRTGALTVAMALILGAAFGLTPSNAVAQDEEVAVAETFVAGDAVVVFDGALNLREAAGLDAEVLEVLADGAALTVIGGPQQAGAILWYQVSTIDETEGWVTGEFITAAATSGEFAVGDAVVVSNGPLNLRDAAGTGATILDTLDGGVEATILAGPTVANAFNWYQIELVGGESGWVAGEFLGFASEDPGDDFAAGDVIVVAQGPLNLRGGASLSGAVLEMLDEGATGTIVDGPSPAGGIQWYQIEVTGGETGWVAGQFIALEGDSPDVPVGGDFPIDSFVFVNAPLANFRAEASISADILDTLTEGNIATVLDEPVAADDYTWYPVAVGEGEDAGEGWVSGSLLSGGIALGEEAVVVDGPLNLREDASTNAEAFAALQIGDTVTIVDGPIVGGGFIWFEVESGEDTGFVAGRYLGSVAE